MVAGPGRRHRLGRPANRFYSGPRRGHLLGDARGHNTQLAPSDRGAPPVACAAAGPSPRGDVPQAGAPTLSESVHVCADAAYLTESAGESFAVGPPWGVSRAGDSVFIASRRRLAVERSPSDDITGGDPFRGTQHRHPFGGGARSVRPRPFEASRGAFGTASRLPFRPPLTRVAGRPDGPTRRAAGARPQCMRRRN